MTAVIAIANHKGGVAKTTTCLSLGGALTEQGFQVLVVDLDPQAHLTLSLGFRPEEMRHTVAEVLLEQQSIVAVSRETQVAGLDLVPASGELVILDKALYGRPGYEFRLREALARMSPLYDFILMDCPPSFGTITLNALTAAHLLVIPVQCEYYAWHSLRSMLELVTLIREKTNPILRYRLLVTMFDVRSRVHRLVLEQVHRVFSSAVFRTIIQVDARIRESPAHGLPVVYYAPKTRAAMQYRALAEEVVATLSSARPPVASPPQVHPVEQPVEA
ncbi:MAG: ParA family protein [Anaerolineae bacterium]|nr:ParA family protein [Anaerolineae bacterium]MDW8068613.1 ParA family protein [Anaerolineae bacterium]